jgi:hypothetical protein
MQTKKDETRILTLKFKTLLPIWNISKRLEYSMIYATQDEYFNIWLPGWNRKYKWTKFKLLLPVNSLTVFSRNFIPSE